MRFSAAEMETLDQKQYKMVFNFRKKLAVNVNMGRGMVLSGPPGVGKTWAMAALTREQGGDYVFITAPEFFDMYASYDRDKHWDAYRNQDVDRTFERVPWLVLNDLGKEYRGGKLGEQIPYKLGRLLRARAERLKSTFITTNMALVSGVDSGGDTLESVYGGSIVSLLSETTKAFVIQGSDRRKSR
jgi:DNA replication protein DnaC